MSVEGEPLHRQLDAAFVGGLAWTAGAKWVTQLVTWLSVLIAVWLLSPADFGIVDMASFFTILTNVLAEFGIGTAVLQIRELDRRVLAQLNTVSLVFSTLAFGVSVATAPLVADFFRSGQLKLLIIVNSLGFFLTAVQAVPQGLLQRDMDYRRLSLAEAVQAIVQAAVTVGAAFAGMGYWSLLAGVLSGKATSAALTAFWKPVPFGLPRWKEVAVPMRFGLEVALSRLAWSAYSQADGVIVGRMLGPSALGIYRLAIGLASAPANKIALLLMRVTGPLFARIQDDRGMVRRYFLFISDAVALSVFPLVLGLTAVAPEAVTVLGPKWAATVVPIQWLAVFMTLQTMNSLMSQVLTSLRFTTFLMWMSILSFVVMPLSFFVAVRWGINAVAATWIVMAPATMLPIAVKLFRSIDCTLREYLAILAPATVGSVVMLCVVLALKAWVLPANWPPMWRLAIEVVAGGSAYASILLGFFRPMVLRYVHLLMRLRKDREALLVTEV